MAYHTMWGSELTDDCEREIDAVMLQHNLNVMNMGAPSRILYEVESAIDLSLCTPQIRHITWTVLSSPGDSDHCAIAITYNETRERESTVRWAIEKKANRDAYAESNA